MVSQFKSARAQVTARNVQLAAVSSPVKVSTVAEQGAPDLPVRTPKTGMYVAIAYTVCCIVWGTTWYAMRVCVEPGDGFPPNFSAAIRFVVAVALYIPIWAIFCRKERKPTLSEIGWLSLAGVFNGLYQSFIYCGETSVSGGLAAVVSATSPIMVALICMGMRIEKVSRMTVLGFCLCFAGVALVCLDRLQVSKDQAVGIVFVLVAAIFNSCANVTLKGKATGLHPIISATIFLAATDVPVWIASFLAHEKWTLFPLPFAPTSAVVYMAIASSIVAFSLYLYMIKHVSLMAVSTMPFLLPVLALVIDAFLEKRVVLSTHAWIGIAVVLAGVVLSIAKRSEKQLES